MKRLLLSIILSMFFVSVSAQDFEIVSVESLPADMSAREEMKTDHNDLQCALLRIATQNIAPNQREAFSFVPDLGSEVVERATRDGEIWLWVSPGLKYLRIKHRDWGQLELRLIDYVARVEALHTYKVTIKGTMAMALQEQNKKTPAQQYLVFQLSPTNAVLEVDDQLWEVGPDGSAMKFVNFGTYTYRVQAPNYLPETGKVTVDDPENTKTVSVRLKPDFVEVTLKVDADAEIWVNKEKKGVRTWSGTLGKGIYKIECKQDNHETTTISQEITESTNGKTITLPTPKPICGSLNIESTPIGATIQVDNKEVGKTPKSINEILVGQHEITLTKDGFFPYTEMVTVAKGERKQVKATLKSHGIVNPVGKPQQSVVKPTDGFFFIMANATYSIAPQTSVGLTIGSVKKTGLYASVNSNFRFEYADYECDYEGYINELSSEYSYSGEKSSSRLGATIGMVFRFNAPLYAYAGVGYGLRNVFWQLDNGLWAKCTDDSYQGITMDAGLMLHFKSFGLSLGVQTIGVKYMEAKIGIGYTLKR